MKLKEVMQLLQRDSLTPWHIEVIPRPPSDILKAHLQRLQAFDLKSSEQAKTLLIDALFAEIVPLHPKLKIWKAATLSTDIMTGIADYLMAPHRAYLGTPLMCVVEAKRDDFEQGTAQCIAEMVACQWNNQQENVVIDVFGIVSNGQGWQFYKLTKEGEIFETDLLAMSDLPELLGTLDYLCTESDKNIP